MLHWYDEAYYNDDENCILHPHIYRGDLDFAFHWYSIHQDNVLVEVGVKKVLLTINDILKEKSGVASQLIFTSFF